MKDKKFTILIIILVIIAIVAGALLAIKMLNKQTVITNGEEKPQSLEAETEKDILIMEDVKSFAGNKRPIAVMIDNVGDALPQAGLNDAEIVYEIIVEGGMTRLMAVFEDVNLDKIGPVRSARHYFLDYALENDAIYVHYGWSPQAQSDISKLKVNNINGLYDTGFWRVTDKAAPHNAVISTEKLEKLISNKKYRDTSDKDTVLNYVKDELNLENGTEALNVEIPYSDLQNVKYKYNTETKMYERTANSKLAKDWTTKEVVSTKNIIITLAKNTKLDDGEGKDRQNLNNIGTLDGYYITNGKAIKIKCEKTSRNAQTVYKDLEGNEIKVNDGNTFIQICPINTVVNFN